MSRNAIGLEGSATVGTNSLESIATKPTRLGSREIDARLVRDSGAPSGSIALIRSLGVDGS